MIGPTGSTPSYHLRPATIDDAPAIVDLQVHGWKHNYKGIIDQSYLDNIDSKKRLEWRLQNMAKGDSWTFVVEHKNQVIGECDIGVSRIPELGKGEIFAFYVDKDHHRKGVGTLLWNAAIQKLTQENLTPYIVLMLAQNLPARAFYQAMGGVLCGETKNTIDGKLYDEVIYKYI
jgi:RimJ/RimL family protein N-acetyltransferase